MRTLLAEVLGLLIAVCLFAVLFNHMLGAS